MPIGYGTNTSALASSFANASASSSKVTLESQTDKRSIRNQTRKLIPWSRRGRKSASADFVKDGPSSDIGLSEPQILAGRSLTSSPGGSEEAFETHIETLIPTPWPCEDRPENCPSITSVPPYKHSTFYRLHAPTGPPYYINHHLRPPNQSAHAAAQHPVSAFSSSFPPLAAVPQGSPPLRTIRLGGLTTDRQYSSFQVQQSSSESVLPTPDSSSSIGFAGASSVSYQNRDELNAMSMKNMLAAADVDQLDFSSPWGQRFHHDSPYDLGQRKGKKPVRSMGGYGSVSATDLCARVPSNARFSRPTTPSPLSQSTPAVNIQTDNQNNFPPPRRKLSKRRPSGLQAPPTTSPSPDSDSPSESHPPDSSLVDYGAAESGVSMTVTAISQNAPSQVTDSTVPGLSRKLSKKRPSQFQFPSTQGYIPSPEKNRGPNVFSRMAKRISFGMGNLMSGGTKRGMVFERRLGHKGSFSMTDVTVLSKERYNPSPQDISNLVTRDGPSQQEPKKQGPRRVPPPSFEEPAPSTSAPASQISIEPSPIESTSETAPVPAAPQLPEFLPDSSTFNIFSPLQQKSDIRDSLLSTDAEPEWSLGKLTIANPDLAGGSDTDTSLRGKHQKLTPLPRPQNRITLMDPDPRASIRAEIDSRSSLHDPDVRFSRSFTSESVTPVQNPQTLQSPRPEPPERVLPPPPPKDRESAATSETVTAQDLRVSMTESSVTPTSTRLSSRVSSPELPPTPQDVSVSSHAPSNVFPPPPPSKQAGKPKIDVSIQGSQHSHSGASAESSGSNNHSSAEIISPSIPRLHGRQEHVYIVDVPVDGPLFVRPSPDGTSIPPVEKPELPPLPPKPRAPENATNSPLTTTPSSVRQSKERKEKETTIFTSLFSTPRSRRTSETSPRARDGSPHDRSPQGVSSRPSRRARNSPEKPYPVVATHSRSPTNTSTESRSREERVKSERDHYASRRGDRRSYLEKRNDSDGDSGNKHRESRSYSQDEDHELRREQERRQVEHEERQAREKAKERERQRLREEEERVTRGRREREEEERRARRKKEREEEERRERKAREKEEEERRLRRAREREEEERRLRRAKEKEAEERRAREDEERRLRRAKEKEEEERRLQREKERIEEEKRARREREEQERRIRKAKEEEEQREREERRERRRLEEERRLKKEEEERKAREEAKREEERRRRKEEEERRREEEESRRRKREEEEERKAKREDEERRRREEEERRRRREEEERRRKEEEERRRRDEEERKTRKEEEERKLREQEESMRKEEERRARRQQKELERLEASLKAQEEAERKEREWQERKAREEEQQRREREREFIRQREMETEQRHQEDSGWRPEPRSFYSMFSDRPMTSTAGSSYLSNYTPPYMGGHDWEPAPRPKKRSHDIHNSGKQPQTRREPARLPDINRRAELGIYSPESVSTTYRRPRAVSLESPPSQPPTPPYKDTGSSLRRQQTNGHVHPSVSAGETTFVRPRFPRPVSGVPSPGVFKASEAWEHDRFWRGQSMNFDSGSAVSSSVPPPSWVDHSYSYEASIPSVPYFPPDPHQGSSYTSYMVQPPAWSYPHYQHAAPIEPFSIPPSSNPLPPPPRQSNYQLESHSPP